MRISLCLSPLVRCSNQNKRLLVQISLTKRPLVRINLRMTMPVQRLLLLTLKRSTAQSLIGKKALTFR